MKLEVPVNAVIPIDIDSQTAFRVLCSSLSMDFVLSNEGQYFVRTAKYGEKEVWERQKDGSVVLYDDRGELFVALSNVAVQMFPNLPFRGEDYIY